jgi:hypothetical protein
MRVDFSVDKDKCLKEIKDFNRIKKIYCNNPYYFFNYYRSLEGKSTKEIIEFFKNNKEEIEYKLIKRKKLIEKNWSKINNIFFSEIERITENKWKYKNYKCHICAVCAGEYTIYKNSISVFAFFNKADYLAVVAEELLHLHFWEIIKKLKIKMRYKDWKNFKENFYWQLSECIPCLIFSHSNIKLKLKFGKYPGWKHIRKLFKKIKPLWEDRKSFRDFLLNSIKLCKC